MQVNASKYLSYCSGVKKAINRVLELLKEEPDKEIYMLGDIVHNPYVVKKLVDEGVHIVYSIDDVPDGGMLVIRAHGTVTDTYKRAKEKNLTVIDATCSVVLENQKLVRDLENKVYVVVLIGNKNHDEVISITSFAEEPIIISSKEEVHENRDKLKKVGVIVQTTEVIQDVKDIIAELVYYAHELLFFNTICAPSRVKQDEVIRLAKENDVTYIVGSETSQNTRNLYYLAQKYSHKVFYVGDKSSINPEDLAGVKSAAVVAGTSTPEYITDEIIEYLKSF